MTERKDYGYTTTGFNPLTHEFSTGRKVFNISIVLLTLGLAIPILAVVNYMEINQSPDIYRELRNKRETTEDKEKREEQMRMWFPNG
jgi:hypothetical protein